MSRFRETHFVRRITHKLAWNLIFWAAVWAADFAVMAQAGFAGTNAPGKLFQNFDLPSNLSSNLPAISSNQPAPLIAGPATNSQPAGPVTATTNKLQSQNAAAQTDSVDAFTQKLETACYLRKIRQFQEAKPLLVALLDTSSPEPIQKSALLELAALVQDEDDLPRTQDIYAQFLNRWPNEPRVPEVLLHQGQIFRQMGLHNLALAKFYAVMTAALILKNDRLDYYEHLVVEAQIEIAETHYELGKYTDAAEYFSRLFKQGNPEIDKPQVLYKLIRCYSSTTNYDEAVAYSQDYLAHFSGAPEEPEVRYDLASALKELGRDTEALQQVLTLLREQNAQAKSHPETWAYWRQRTGNLIANQFFREGNYPRALDIYTSLAQLDYSPQWQLPVWYQIGMTYERLWQPQKATETYNQIISRESELDTNAPPSLKAIVDMARWRIGFIQWQSSAENANHDLHNTNTTFTASTANPAPKP
jgi:tetratricopeptide (TPR) repeat protein